MEYAIGLLGLWLLLLTALFVKHCRKAARENQDDYNDLSKQINENTEVALRMDMAREKQIKKLEAETPRATINDKNEAVLIFEGKEILNYDLKTKKTK